MSFRGIATFFCLAIVLLFHPAAQAFEGATFVYVSLDARQSIAVYTMDKTDGSLAFVKAVAIAGQPGALAVDPTHRFLYAAIRSTHSVASYRIDAESGDLTLIDTVDVGWNPAYLSLDRSGRYLFTAHFADNKAAVYRIGSNGAVRSGALQTMSTAANAHSILTDRSNRFLFVPCRTAETILQYRFNETTGGLTPNVPDRIATPDSTGPRHLTFHPFLNTAYAANEYGRSVTAYRIDTSNGTLTPMQTLPMQPGDPRVHAIAANSGGADIHTTPDGRFLYATTRGPDSIAAYALDPATGLMTSLARYPAEKMPRSFAIDPSGKFLFAAGQASGMLAAYRIGTADGSLSPVKTYAVGSNPVWILIVGSSCTLPAPPSSWQSKFMRIENGTLAAIPDEKENIIPDFSRVGYDKGRSDIPTVRIVKTISAPIQGDAQLLIQSAIDDVARMPADAGGFRGTVLLKKGVYKIPGSVIIAAGGIVLRGEGADSAGTVLVASGKGQRSLIVVAGPGAAREIAGTRRRISDPYVPVGSFSFAVEDGALFSRGDMITLLRPGTDRWIRDLKMDRIIEGQGTKQWKAEDYDLKFERQITRVDGNRIWIDQPVVMAMDTTYGGGFIYKCTNDRIRRNGIENLLCTSEYVSETDEDHGWCAVEFKNCQDGWVRAVVSKYFGNGCVLMTASTAYITVTDAKCLEAKSIVDGGRRYSFTIEGQMCLVKHCETTDGRHDYVTEARVCGPNVFFNCSARNAQNDIGPHHRWSVGTLYDNITTDGEINVQDRGNYGTGHGWAGANQVLWNCHVKKAAVQNPWVSATNWCIGLSGEKYPGRFTDRPDGEWEGLNLPGLQPASLYMAQVAGSSVKDSIALENEYVTVLRNSSAARSPELGTRVIVALGTMTVHCGKSARNLERGGVAVVRETDAVESPIGEYFEVNFKKHHPPLKEPEQWIEPEKNTMVYEDDAFRVFEERLPPGGERALHSHAQRVVVRLNEVQLTDPRYFPNGTPGGGIQVPNTVKFAEPMVHVVRNLGSIPLFNIVIEYKLPRGR